MGDRTSSCCTIYGFSSASFFSVAIVGEIGVYLVFPFLLMKRKKKMEKSRWVLE